MSTRTHTAFEDTSTAIGVIILTGGFIFGLYIADGFVMKMVWNWFVPHIFSGAPRLSIAEAIGLALIPSAFWGRIDTRKKEKDKELPSWRQVAAALSKLSYILILGWIVHSFFL